MKLIVVAVLACSVAAFAPNRNPKDAKAQRLHDYINSIGTTWKAVETNKFPPNKLMDVKFTKLPEGVEYLEEVAADTTIPESFNARDQWPDCTFIDGWNFNQGMCASGWAIAVAEVLTDRFCIASNGRLWQELAPEDPLSCCGSFCGNGCDGGYPIRAWQWAIKNGICTGANYGEIVNQYGGCKPASINGCTVTPGEDVNTFDCPVNAGTPTCKSTCTNPHYNVTYENDKYFAKSAYAVRQSVLAIQTEIMKNGPVVATLTVYEDFKNYRKGVYQHKAGNVIGGHAVKIIGWGTDNGTPYWLAENSWTLGWGELGNLRILRGQNECGIEEGVVAGLAKV